MAYVGIDLHKKNFVACYRTRDKDPEIVTFTKDDEGIGKFLETVSCFDCVAVEASGISRPFVKRIRPHVHDVKLVAPSKFSLIAKSDKKTDKVDAAALALGLEKGFLPLARTKSEAATQIMAVYSARTLLVRAKVQCVHQANSVLARNGVDIGRAQIRTLGQWERLPMSLVGPGDRAALSVLKLQFAETARNIDRLERSLKKLAQEMPGYELLIGIPGIGAVTTAILLATIDGIENFESPKKLAAYFGIVPKVHSSGSHRWTGYITKAGSIEARSLLIWAGWKAMYKNSSLLEFYTRIRERRGPGKARGAVGRKLLTLIFYVLTHDQKVEDFSALDFSDLVRSFPVRRTG